MGNLILAIDQGTTSTRCMIFNHQGDVVSIAQKEHRQIYPQPGWVEHDPFEILDNVNLLINQAIDNSQATKSDIAAIGITNQRETTLLWDRRSGIPLTNAIVWQDTRTNDICNNLANNGGQNRFRESCGLPLATYFSAPKIKWILEHVPAAGKAAREGNALFGTIDTWLIWNLTGGPNGGIHATDVTNASRTMLMNLSTLDWDPDTLNAFDIPATILPKILPSSFLYGQAKTILTGVPISGVLGDQQAALFGQTCFSPGEAKNTYGTGCFMLLNTGQKQIQSKNGLLTTLGYQIGEQPPVYCLEGSIAISGALVQWLRDNLNLFEKSSDIEALAGTADDNGGIYFVPAFSGLFAPYWRGDARGVIVGLTRFIHRGHLARAALEATAYQTKDVMEAMQQDSGVPLVGMKVDGGMVSNELLMQFQADILNVPIIRPAITETTALGAAFAAGLVIDFWNSTDDLKRMWKQDKKWVPKMDHDIRNALYTGWKKAIERTYNWVD